MLSSTVGAEYLSSLKKSFSSIILLCHSEHCSPPLSGENNVQNDKWIGHRDFFSAFIYSAPTVNVNEMCRKSISCERMKLHSIVNFNKMKLNLRVARFNLPL